MALIIALSLKVWNNEAWRAKICFLRGNDGRVRNLLTLEERLHRRLCGIAAAAAAAPHR